MIIYKIIFLYTDRTGPANSFKSQCFSQRDNKNCSGTRESTLFTDGNKQIKFQAKDTCKFPFIYKNVEYQACMKRKIEINSDQFWCATRVSETNHTTKWGYCSDSCPMIDTGW